MELSSSALKLNDSSLYDLLRYLCSDGADPYKQIGILVKFQEEHSSLLPYEDRVEQVIGSLWDLFNQLKPNPKVAVVKNQILVTITAVLLLQDNLVENVKLGNLFVALVNWLLSCVANVNKNPCAVREVSCQCLIEIEEHFPGLLACHLDKLKQYCKQECSYAFQSYANLYAIVLKNCNAVGKKSWGKSMSDQMKNAFGHCDSEVYPLSSDEYNEMVVYLVDHFNHMTESSAYCLLQQLVAIMKFSTINSSILKPIFLQCLSTFDISIFHLIFQLKDEFGISLLSRKELDRVSMQLMQNSDHPLWQDDHRHLLLDWLENTSNKCAVNNLWPLPFDDLCTHIKKATIACRLAAESEDFEQMCALFCSCLHKLQRLLRYVKDNPTAVALYKTLYASLITNENIHLTQIIHRCAMDTFCNHPQFANNFVEFVDSVKLSFPDSAAEKCLITEIDRCISSLNLDRFLENPFDYLHWLQNIANRRVVEPQIIVSFLLRLMENHVFLENGSWESGHAMLSACQSLMTFYDTQSFFQDLAEVLYILSTEYKEVDVQNRAQLYYLIINNISSRKLTSLFKLKSGDKNVMHNLNTFMTGSSTFSFPSPVINTTEPLLKLTRVNSFVNLNHGHGDEVYADAIQRHMDWISGKEFSPRITFQYMLNFEESGIKNDFKNLYGIEIICNGELHLGKIDDIVVPCLTTVDGGVAITICIEPTKPLPGKVEISAVFSSSSGLTCYHKMPDLNFNLEDFFQQFPVPDDCHSSAAFRKQLFYHFWNNMETNCGRDGIQKSVYCFNAKAVHVKNIVCTQLESFVVDTGENDDLLFALGIFLLPMHHLLMKFSVLDDAHTIITMLTNYWAILPLLNIYFARLGKMTTTL